MISSIKYFEDGIEHSIERRPILKPEVYPKIFQNLPSYLTKIPDTHRKDPQKRTEIQQRHENVVSEWIQADLIQNFSSLQGNYKEKLGVYLKDQWHDSCLNNDYILLYRLNVEPGRVPAIGLSIKIVQDLSFTAYVQTSAMNKNDFHWLCQNGTLEQWCQVENLLSYCLNKDIEKDVTLEDHLIKTHESLAQAINLLSTFNSADCHISDKTLEFFYEQLHLVAKKSNSRRYSSQTQCFAFMTYIKSPACYRFIRKSKLLCLPHPSTLKRLIPTMSTDLDVSKYLQVKSENMSSREKVVAIQMDEIYVKSAVSYTGGKIFGTASNSKESATTVQAFMISSMFGNYTEVVGLIPMKKMTTCDLKTNLLKTIHSVQSSGFTVLSVIADNNAVNRKVYTELQCTPDIYSFDNPQFFGKPIFMLNDSVHLLKCIWHNWLNQKDADQTFICPPFPVNSGGPVMKATLSSLKSLYHQGQQNIAKLVPALTHKALNPSSLDRQKVSLALGVFNNYNVAALQLVGQNDTANFINVILQWWSIANVKNKYCGTRTRNSFANPITNEDKSNLRHLIEFRQWLEAWRNLDSRGGKLTSETFSALTRTVNAVVQISEYALNTLGIEYVLLGKLQTDNLEARFSEYRQLSGANYLVSVQVLEAEKKLKVYSLLCICSSSFGDVAISDMSSIFETDNELEDAPSMPSEFRHAWFFLNVEDCEIIVPDGTVEVLVYISGFLAFRVSKKLK
ncbi:hypothetical protein BsWGS_16733 [Bradybaena similaris]